MMQDKYKELQIIQNSEVDWTIVRLPFVIEGNGIGNIKESLVDMPNQNTKWRYCTVYYKTN